jgi:hypothetical protein
VRPAPANNRPIVNVEQRGGLLLGRTGKFAAPLFVPCSNIAIFAAAIARWLSSRWSQDGIGTAVDAMNSA